MSASLCSPSLLVGLFVLVSAGQKELTVKQGANATLECHGSSDAPIKLLSWKKPDLQSKLYVFFFRDNSPVEIYQHESFKGRVQLKDPEMKNGDFTLILKNFTKNDAGRYECYAGYGKRDDSTEPVSTITLKIVESGSRGGPEKVGLSRGHPGLVASRSLLVLVVLLLVVC